MRTLDPRHLNDVANHPTVRPYLKGRGEIDLSSLVSDPANICLQYEGGGWVLRNIGGCCYDVHSMFLPEVRGQKVASFLEDALRYVFIECDAVKLVTRLPKGNLAARALAKKAGFRTWFSSGIDGDEYGVLHIEDWVQRSYACRQAGQAFHEKLERLKLGSGSDLEFHPEDAAHDHAAGAAYLMCLSGNAAKGVWHYNQWALIAGYATIDLISVSPLMVDMRDAILHGPNMEVALCR